MLLAGVCGDLQSVFWLVGVWGAFCLGCGLVGCLLLLWLFVYFVLGAVIAYCRLVNSVVD